MKILHTADWHLGKQLFGKSRIAEQRLALEELNALCDRERVDVILVCGDIFDTFVPKAEAEELFFEQAVLLSRNRIVVCLAGNHDDGERLSAPNPIAKANGIYLAGGFDLSAFNPAHTGGNTALIEAGEGFLRFSIGGEVLNLALLAYPFAGKFPSVMQGGTNNERVGNLIEKCCLCFGEGVNVFASHLFMDGCSVAEDRELGTSPVLNKSIIPPCDYAALGHIHKTQSLSKQRNIFYSGSLLNYSFKDTFKKEFIIYDSCDKSVKKFPVTSGKPMISKEAFSSDEAIKICADNPDAYVQIIYKGEKTLSALDIKELKNCPSFTDLVFVAKRTDSEVVMRAESSPSELFTAFYKAEKGKEPSEETLNLFLQLLE